MLNTGRLQHQWHTMTKTGKVAKLNKLNSGPFVEIHPDDAAALGIADGRQVEIVSRRGRAVLPAVVTDRVRPGNCFGAVPLERRARRVPRRQRRHQRRRRPGLAAAGVQGVRGAPRPACRSSRPCRCRLVGGARAHRGREALSGRILRRCRPGRHPACRCCPPLRRSADVPGCGSTDCWPACILAARGVEPVTEPSTRGRGTGPLVLWASQTGNAEEFAGTLGGPARRCPADGMDDVDLADLSGAVTSSSSPARSATAGRRTTAPTSGRGWTAPDAPSLDGVRFAVLGIGDRSYDNFCGYAKSLDTRLADLGATRMLDRAELRGLRRSAAEPTGPTRWCDLMAPTCGRLESVQEPESTAPARRAVHPRHVRSPRRCAATPR